MYKFIVDTNSYAGNFEREMCAYLTGKIGECEVGWELAEIFEKENTDNISFDNIRSIKDKDDSCTRPCSTEITPGWFNDGLGNYYKENDYCERDVLKKYYETVRDYNTKLILNIERTKVRLENGEEVSNWTIDYCSRDILNYQKKIKEAENLKKINKYAAYNSVVIFFKTKPSKVQIDLMKSRAIKFKENLQILGSYTADNIKEFEIEGFRLIKKETTETEIEV